MHCTLLVIHTECVCVCVCVCIKSIYCLDDNVNKPQGDMKFVCDGTQPCYVSTDNAGVMMVYDTARQSYMSWFVKMGSVDKQQQQYAINEDTLIMSSDHE